jgi:basic membrane lipoprotein Med (substrate-binding protein (PBP1-ABC) superfamily)
MRRYERNVGIATTTAVVLIIVVALIVGAGVYVATRPAAPVEIAKLKIGVPYTTPIEEPWDGCWHEAFTWAKETYAKELGIEITYDWTDDVGYSDLPAVLREWAPKYDIIWGDTFGCEEAARGVAKDFPDKQFIFGSGLGPVEPNVCVSDDWIHEPAYICGMIAGKLTRTNIIGIVGGVPVPEVNRLVNAFKAGAKEVNPNVKVKITFIGEWFNPPLAKEKALAQIGEGADVMYAERYGVHEAALEKLTTENKVIPVFGSLLDQYELAPNLIITGPVWDLKPTIKYVIDTYIMRDGKPFAMDLAEWSMVGKGGAKLAGWPGLHDWETRLNPDIVARMRAEGIINMIETRWAQILDGTFRVDIDESVPVSD